MKHFSALIFSFLLFISFCISAQTDGVNTYMNPVLPGNHPDQTLLKVGDDYYTAGSSFHWAPNLPIYHSTDLVHWEVISTVVSPTWNVVLSNQGPKDGTWQGALANFAGKYWAFFFIHGGGQYFCNATSMAGPWTAPTLVNGSVGYDNSVFVDDNGKAYMLMKNGQDFAAIQELNANGQLTGTRMDMSWVNRDHVYSWAEGPKMCKRNGRYYYFVAGHVYGGQYVLSSATLTGNEASWTRHGNFFRGNAIGAFTGPNHISQPVQISDGTWWGICHSYGNSGWEGQGRQSMLFQVFWDANGVPYANNPNGQPLIAPDLPSNGVNYEFPESDNFSGSILKLEWYFHSIANMSKASLSARPGFLRLSPGSGVTHILQREPSKNFSLVTKVEINAAANGQEAGLRLMNGEDLVYAEVYSGYNNGKKLGINFNGIFNTEINNNIGNTVWLKLVRNQHNITGFYSADGIAWVQIGANVRVADLDKAQENDNAWVGTSLGFYAKSQVADFDEFSFNHGFDPINVSSFFHYHETSINGGSVINTSDNGWCMLPGVSMESNGKVANQIVVNAASASASGTLEVWIDNIGTAGKRIASLPVSNTGGTTIYRDFMANVSVSGQHDLYLRFVGGSNLFRLNTVRFIGGSSNVPPEVILTAPDMNSAYTTLQTINLSANVSDADGTLSKVEFFKGSIKIGEDLSSPYTFSWKSPEVGTHSLTAVVTDDRGASISSSPVIVTVTVVQAPYKGILHPVPGRIEAEDYDLGGQGVAYNEGNSNGNQGLSTYRNDQVDIETTRDIAGNYNVAYILKGEWLEYSVDVASSGLYSLDLRIAADGLGKVLHIEIDGEDISGAISIPNTNGWQTWQTITVSNINLTQGENVIRIAFDSDYMNLNFLQFKYQTVTELPDEESSLLPGVAPSPFETGFRLHYPQEFTYNIFDNAGKLVTHGSGNKEAIIGESLISGFYVLQLMSKGKKHTIKITKK